MTLPGPGSPDTLSYFDNAATSFPKPPEVARAMHEFLDRMAVNPGRSGFDLSLAAGQMVDRVRAKLDRFFNNPAADPQRTVFTLNATAALNLAIQGVCRPGDHVVATVLDHNSVLRPLHELTRRGIIHHDLAPCDQRGRIAPSAVVRLLRPETRLVVMTHASNVFGGLQPVAEVGRICRERGILFLVDAAQTAGVVPVDMAGLQADMVAFTGHKGLLGPHGHGRPVGRSQGGYRRHRVGRHGGSLGRGGSPPGVPPAAGGRHPEHRGPGGTGGRAGLDHGPGTGLHPPA